MSEVYEHLADYLEALTASHIRRQQASARAWAERDTRRSVADYETVFMPLVERYAIDDHPRSKYVRVTQSDGGQVSVHCFVDRATGSVYMPASWKSPARGKDGKPSERYNLLDAESRAVLFARCEPNGGYLYADRL